MEHFINISLLNDFVFCPYSIYLHNAYMGLDENQYQDKPQSKGKHAHKSLDQSTYNTNARHMTGTEVYSEKYGLTGKIDIFYADKQRLVERKRTIKVIYDGYKLQLYAQYFCLIEMGYEVKQLGFFSLTNNTSYPLPLPTQQTTQWFEGYLKRFRAYKPSEPMIQNPNKCKYCIYSALCDQANL